MVINDETTHWNGDSDLKLSLLSKQRKNAIKDSKINSNYRTMNAVWKDPVVLNGSCCLFRTLSVKILDAIQTRSSGDFFLKIVSILHLLLINNMSIIWVFFNGQMFKLLVCPMEDCAAIINDSHKSPCCARIIESMRHSRNDRRHDMETACWFGAYGA